MNIPKMMVAKSVRIMSMASIAILFSALTTGCMTEERVTNRPFGGAGVTPLSSEKNNSVSDEELYKTRFELAAAYYQGGSGPVALEEVNRALEIKPRSAEALALKGMVYDQMNKPGEALKHLKRAAEIESSNGNYQHNYGAALCANKQFSEGINKLMQAASMPGNTNQARSWVTVGQCYEDAGDIQKAENSYFQALSVDAVNKQALYKLAEIMFKRNDIQGSMYYFDKLGSMQTMQPEALWLGISMANQQGDAYLKSQYARQLLSNYPNSKEAALLRSERRY